MTYRNFCSACHGVDGGGFGKASRYLFPKPRDFRSSPLQYATSDNRIASHDDILHVVKNGISNSSMNGWNTLTQYQLNEVVKDVLAFRLDGARDRYYAAVIEDLKIGSTTESSASSSPDPALAAYLAQQTIAGPKWSIARPEVETYDLIRGKDLYHRQNCHKCHGNDGRSSRPVDLTGQFGFPAFARNLVHEGFKYGVDKLDVARTIRLGIPGTKMPGSPTLTDSELRDLSRYVLSLRGDAVIETTNIQRYRRAIGATIPHD